MGHGMTGLKKRARAVYIYQQGPYHMNNLEKPYLAPFGLVFSLAELLSSRPSCLVFEGAFVNVVFEPDLRQRGMKKGLKHTR